MTDDNDFITQEDVQDAVKEDVDADGMFAWEDEETDGPFGKAEDINDGYNRMLTCSYCGNMRKCRSITLASGEQKNHCQQCQEKAALEAADTGPLTEGEGKPLTRYLQMMQEIEGEEKIYEESLQVVTMKLLEEKMVEAVEEFIDEIGSKETAEQGAERMDDILGELPVLDFDQDHTLHVGQELIEVRNDISENLTEQELQALARGVVVRLLVEAGWVEEDVVRELQEHEQAPWRVS